MKPFHCLDITYESHLSCSTDTRSLKTDDRVLKFNTDCKRLPFIYEE